MVFGGYNDIVNLVSLVALTATVAGVISLLGAVAVKFLLFREDKAEAALKKPTRKRRTKKKTLR